MEFDFKDRILSSTLRQKTSGPQAKQSQRLPQIGSAHKKSQELTTMHPTILAALAITKPMAIGLGLAALVVLYLGFKATKFAMKMLLLLAALFALALAAWWYYKAHHNSFSF